MSLSERTSEQNRAVAEFLVGMSAVQRALNLKLSDDEGVPYDPSKPMSPEREAKVVQVIRSLSRPR